jgi:hypothetical protein
MAGLALTLEDLIVSTDNLHVGAEGAQTRRNVAQLYPAAFISWNLSRLWSCSMKNSSSHSED